MLDASMNDKDPPAARGCPNDAFPWRRCGSNDGQWFHTSREWLFNHLQSMPSGTTLCVSQKKLITGPVALLSNWGSSRGVPKLARRSIWVVPVAHGAGHLTSGPHHSAHEPNLYRLRMELGGMGNYP